MYANIKMLNILINLIQLFIKRIKSNEKNCHSKKILNFDLIIH